MNNMEIKIVENPNEDLFESDINKLSKKGWVPIFETFKIMEFENEMWYVIILKKDEFIEK